MKAVKVISLLCASASEAHAFAPAMGQVLDGLQASFVSFFLSFMRACPHTLLPV
jgi:hypothetical protein